jgi:hypothetical protein
MSVCMFTNVNNNKKYGILPLNLVLEIRKLEMKLSENAFVNTLTYINAYWSVL